MIDFENVSIHRLKDKSSPGSTSIVDVARTRFLLSKHKIKRRRGVILKSGVEINICKGGQLSLGEHVLVHSGCWLLLTMPNPIVKIGDWVNVGRETIIASKNKIEIGDYTVIAPRCYFVDHEHGFDAGDVILNQRSILRSISIGRDCYFGTGTVVTGGITVGDGAIIGANSVVTQDIGPYEVWAGNPARFIRKREACDQ